MLFYILLYCQSIHCINIALLLSGTKYHIVSFGAILFYILLTNFSYHFSFEHNQQ